MNRIMNLPQGMLLLGTMLIVSLTISSIIWSIFGWSMFTNILNLKVWQMAVRIIALVPGCVVGFVAMSCLEGYYLQYHKEN